MITGLDPNDNTTVDNKNEDYLSGIDSGIEGKKIGIIKEMMAEGIDPAVLSATRCHIKT